MDSTTTMLQVEDGEAVKVNLSSGKVIPCDMVIAGAGVVPNTAFLKSYIENAPNPSLQLGKDRSVLVDEYMWTGEDGTSSLNVFSHSVTLNRHTLQHRHAPTSFCQYLGLYAAGDIARYPFQWLNGETVRIEHYGYSTRGASLALLFSHF